MAFLAALFVGSPSRPGSLAFRKLVIVIPVVGERSVLGSCSFRLLIENIDYRTPDPLKITARCLKAGEYLRMIGYLTSHDHEKKVFGIDRTLEACPS